MSCPSEAVETAALLVTELVTNAVLHARTSIVLTIDAEPGLVVVRVADHSNAMPIQRTYSRDAATGRGLALVDELAAAWGVEHSADGKEVWCEIEFEDSSARKSKRQANRAGSS